jgi:uncharacterized protein (TIGR03437 family)
MDTWLFACWIRLAAARRPGNSQQAAGPPHPLLFLLTVRNAGLAAALASCFLCTALAQAPAYAIATVAGTGPYPYTGEGQPAANVLLFSPGGVAVGNNGTIYFSDSYYQRVFQVTAQGTLTTVAGTGHEGFSGDGGPATAAQLHGPAGLAVDGAGNLYIADVVNERIRKVTPAGIIATVAGKGSYGFSGDGGPATSADLNTPADVKLDAAGNLYIADQANNRIRKVTADGLIHTIAGNGQVGFSGDGGPATAAQLQLPAGVALDGAGNLYISDTSNYRVRKVAAASGNISTIAGTGVTGYSGDGGQATLAQLSDPQGLALDATGNLYIADAITGKLRKVTPNGVISTIAGNGALTLSGGDGKSAAAASLLFPASVALDSSGNIFVSEEEGRRVRRIDAATSAISRVAGLEVTGSIIGDGGNPLQASLYDPYGVAIDAQGNLLISDTFDFRVRKVSGGVITTIAGNGLPGTSGDGGQATVATVNSPTSMALDSSGDIYLDAAYEVRKLAVDGIISQVAGTGAQGYGGDNGPAVAAQLFEWQSQIALDKSGNLYIADASNDRIRMVDTRGEIVTIAGTGTPGFSGDGGPATLAELFHPSGVVVDAAGNIYIADTDNDRVRRIGTNGIIATIAGTGVQGATGDGGPATQAELSAPATLALDSSGNLYVCLPARIRRIDSTGAIATIAGTGTDGYSGDGGPATSALLNAPTGLAFDSSGNIYFADSGNQVVRKLEPAQFFAGGVVNSASLLAGPVAPGEIITIFGTSIGPSQFALPSVTSSGSLNTEIGATQVLFDGIPAPMIFASTGQVSAIVPYEVASQSQTQVRIVYQGQPTNTVSLPVSQTAPALFTANSSGTGQAAALNQDGSVNSVSNPAGAGSIVVFYGTGEGQTNPAGQDGVIATGVYPTPVQAVSVQIGGQTAQVLYAGAAPGEVAGLLQINARIPAGVTGNAVPVVVSVGNSSSRADVVIAVQ